MAVLLLIEFLVIAYTLMCFKKGNTISDASIIIFFVSNIGMAVLGVVKRIKADSKKNKIIGIFAFCVFVIIVYIVNVVNYNAFLKL